MPLLSVIILGIIEGLTEFLPISSTGHLILLEDRLPLGETPGFAETFMIAIQLPAILAVALYFRHQLIPYREGQIDWSIVWQWYKIIVAFLPAAVLGALFDDTIERLFFNPQSVATALIVGGVVLLVLEYRRLLPRYTTVESIGFRMAAAIGLLQCLAMIPGTSRSAATIIGAMMLGVSRAAAAEFSFFLAIPTMLGATTYRIVKNGIAFTLEEWMLTALGSMVAFGTAYLVVALFMSYIRRYSFKPFGLYRILLGCGVLVL